jgi:hypothetical protein
MIADPERRGRSLAGFCRDLAPRLFADLEESGALANLDADALARARREWDCFALYACVRGLVAAGGFNRETAAAIESFHEAALAESGATERAMIAERYAEYGAIGQAGGRDGGDVIAHRLGEAAARHVTGGDRAEPVLAETIGALHQSLVEGATEAVRSASDRP